MFWGTYSICSKNVAYEIIIALTHKVMKKIGFFG